MAEAKPEAQSPLEAQNLPRHPLMLMSMQRLPRWLLAGAALTFGGLLAFAAYLGATLYPDYSQPTGARAQQVIAKTFGLPLDADPHLLGDIVLERFYARDPATGKMYVADMCKGRVTQVIETHKEDGTASYSILLDRRRVDVARVRALVDKSALPEGDATYLGVQMQAGMSDVFPINYGGRLAKERANFKGPKGESLEEYLLQFPSSEIGVGPRVLVNKDNNFLLNSTRHYPYFTTLFGVQSAVFISKLVFLDATSPAGINVQTR